MTTKNKKSQKVFIIAGVSAGFLILVSLAFIFIGWNNGEFSQLATTEDSQNNQIPPREQTNENISSTAYPVSKITDGDTINVVINGVEMKIRIIGLDAPETNHPTKPVQCFGQEATDKLTELLKGKKVYLESDDTQGDTDKYGRSLRYVFLEDGTNISLFMIGEGYAYEYTYDLPYKYQKEFKKAQEQAEGEKKGLWGPACAEAMAGE